MNRSSVSFSESTSATAQGASFASLGLLPALVRAVAEEGYDDPTPIQAQAIPHVLTGRDLLGCAQTGTGKTAAFVLPLLQRLSQAKGTGKIRCLILAPTRELAAQIGERASAYGKNLGLRHIVIYGGVGQRNQEVALRGKPDVLIATPGRLLDLMQQGFVSLGSVELLVLDEADRMLDMGFIHDVRRVVKDVPKARQTLLFSATMPRDIADLAKDILRDPVRVAVTPAATTAETVVQSVYFVPKSHKRALLEKVLREQGARRTIVFTRTKHGANRLSEQLTRGGLTSAAIHGNKSQGARERALEGFRAGTLQVLVATDLAARGIDVDGITHVVNFELPNVPEQYVHRIGRTGRAGADGRAIAFCDQDERPLLADIERLIRGKIPVAGSISADVAGGDVPADAERRPAPAAHGRPHGGPPARHARPQGRENGARHGAAQQGARFQHRDPNRPAAPRAAEARPNQAPPQAGRQAQGRPSTQAASAEQPPAARRRRRFRGARLPENEIS